jgi:6-phosphogluconolactonase
MDRIYSCHLDRAKGKLSLLCETEVETGSAPRYGICHPALPVFYQNNESNPVLFAYHYDTKTGELNRIGAAPLISETYDIPDGVKIQSSDIIIHPSGKYLYTVLRGLNQIVVTELNADGSFAGAAMTRKQVINCGGIHPRGLSLSPDERFLFAANMESGSITIFSVEEDGNLEFTGRAIKAPCPANIKFIEV